MNRIMRCITLVLVSFICQAGLTTAETAWLSGPSLSPFGNTVTVTGGGLPADTPLTLTITAPDATQNVSYVSTDVDGNVQATFTAAVVGNYTLELSDSTNARLATATLACAEP